MFKRFKKNDNYFVIAVYAFLVIAAAIGLIWVLMHFDTITSWIGGVIGAMLPFVYGFIIAYMCNPIYKKLHKYVFKFFDRKKPHPKLRKAFSIILTYIIFIAIIAAMLLAIVPSLISSLSSLLDNIMGYIGEGTEWLENTLNKLSNTISAINSEEIMTSVNNFFSTSGEGGMFASIINYLKDNLSGILITFIDQIFSILVGFILSIYFLIYKDTMVAKLKKILCAMFKEKNYNRIINFARYTDKTFGRYMLGVILDSTLVGVIMFVILAILDYDYAILIAVTCGITNVIPFFGPFIGAIPSGLLILIATGDPIKVLIFAVIVLILQQVDGNIIAPYIQGTATGLTPIGVIAAVTFASHVFKFTGMVIGVPLCAVVTYYVSCLVKSKLRKKHMPTHTDYYRVKDIYEDENFSKARFALEAEEQLDSSETIATAAIKEEVLQEIKEKVVEEVMHEALDHINEEVEAKAKEGEV